jgi:hypothetical protein
VKVKDIVEVVLLYVGGSGCDPLPVGIRRALYPGAERQLLPISRLQYDLKRVRHGP